MLLDLRDLPCPLNVVKCKLALEKLSRQDILLVELDKGEPEIMVKRTLEKMGYKVNVLKEETDLIRFEITYDSF
tara:strand:- start:313 stop:534 length:222 start_codon:yes stop_codon:yes gene_type:complete